MNFLSLTGIFKNQGNTCVLDDISFTQQQFEKIVIAGETGSGKSTLLKIIAGLIQKGTGEVFFEDQRVLGPEEKLMPGHPGIAYLSQQFELPNNYFVEEVLEYANKITGEEAASLYEICRISHLLKRKTDQISGGEKQRIALARLLTGSPRLLLLDEPYSNLDMIHKSILKKVVRDIGDKLKISCILVSHDPVDTLSWAGQVMVMKDGQIIQKAPPIQVYRQPVNEYVAALFGTYNLIGPDLLKILAPAIASADGGKNRFTRPEDFQLTDAAHGTISGVVKEVIFLGSSFEIEAVVSGETIFIKTNHCNCEKDDTIYMKLQSELDWYLK